MKKCKIEIGGIFIDAEKQKEHLKNLERYVYLLTNRKHPLLATPIDSKLQLTQLEEDELLFLQNKIMEYNTLENIKPERIIWSQ